MKYSITGQEKVTFQYRWLLNRGDHMDRFDGSFRWMKNNKKKNRIVYFIKGIWKKN